MSEEWLRLDELENAIDNLEMAGWFLEKISAETRWKWTIIAIHQALYGFAVCAVRGSDGSRIVRDDGRPISIWGALDCAQDPDWLPFRDSKPLVTSPEEDKAIERLVSEFRNEFVHFRPKHWSIEVSGMPRIVGHVLRVIRFLALEANCVLYPDSEQRFRVETALTTIDTSLMGSFGT